MTMRDLPVTFLWPDLLWLLVAVYLTMSGRERITHEG